MNYIFNEYTYIIYNEYKNKYIIRIYYSEIEKSQRTK